MTPGRPGAGGDGPPSDWATILEQMEAEVLAAEETMAPDSDRRGTTTPPTASGRRAHDWVPPSAPGPVPGDLRERAARLLQHQLAVAEALVEQITQSQRQRDLAARMSHGPSRPVPTFIDRAL